MALKKPGELFDNKGSVEEIPKDLGENLVGIKEEFNKVKDLRKQIDIVSSNLNNSLTEVVDQNLNYLTTEYTELLNKFNNKIETFKEELSNEVKDIRKSHVNLNAEVTIIETRQKNLKLDQLKEDIIGSVQNLLNGNVLDNIKHLEERVDIINEKHIKILTETYNEPPSVKNSDPLTPLDQNFSNLQDFQEHYRLFLNRIQRQLSTLGGGGAVLITDLDDVDTSTAKVDNKFLKYNASSGKWVGSDTSGGGYTLPVGSGTTLGGVKVGSGLTITATGVLSTTGGSGSIAGISTTGTSVFNQINASGIVTATTFVGDGSGLTGITGSGSGVVVKHDGSTVGTAGTINFSTNLDVSAISAGIVTVTANAGSGSTATISSDDIVTDGITVGVGTITICGTNLFTSNSVVVDGITTSTSFSGSAAGLTNLTGASSGTYGSSSAIPVVIVDGNGRITGISTVAISGGGLSDVVSDTSPQLGGDLDINGRDIVSTSNGNIDLDPNGSGKVVFKGNSTKGSGQFVLNCEQNSHGITIKGPPHSASASYTLTLPNTDGSNGQVLKTDGSGGLDWVNQNTGTLGSRQTNSATTGSIAQAASTSLTIATAGKSFSLLSVTISAPAYVILYVDSTTRSADSSRTEGTDPAPGSGVITEVSTTASGSTTFLMTPAVLGWNNDGTPAAQIYAKVVNKRATSGSNAITVTLKTVALEA